MYINYKYETYLWDINILIMLCRVFFKYIMWKFCYQVTQLKINYIYII